MGSLEELSSIVGSISDTIASTVGVFSVKKAVANDETG
jgi:hypothetical protein